MPREAMWTAADSQMEKILKIWQGAGVTELELVSVGHVVHLRLVQGAIDRRLDFFFKYEPRGQDTESRKSMLCFFHYVLLSPFHCFPRGFCCGKHH